MELNNIVVGSDGSDNADKAVEAAAQLAGVANGTVHVIAVSSARDDAEVLRVLNSMPEEFQGHYTPGAHEQQILDAARVKLRGSGVACEMHRMQGDVASAILEVADNVDADLIVVGSRGLARGTRHLRGSVSTRIAGHAERNFLVVHHDS